MFSIVSSPLIVPLQAGKAHLVEVWAMTDMPEQATTERRSRNKIQTYSRRSIPGWRNSRRHISPHVEQIRFVMTARSSVTF